MRSTARRIVFPELPARLLDLEEPPAVLHVRGELPRGPAIALVGTRTPSDEARVFAYELAFDLARAGVAVLSGGAAGIDTEVHRGAVQAGGTTVVVAPAGFQRPFPDFNRDLFHEIVSHGGAYVSLVADRVPATNASFFPRNACLAALAHVTVIVEAPWRSGARNTAAWARKLRRPLFAVPSAPWNPKGRGCNEELRLGARVVESAKELLRWLSAANLHALPPPSSLFLTGPEASSEQLPLAFEQDDESRVLGAVAEGAAHADEICARTGLSAARVQGLVLTLRLKGALVPAPDGRLRRSSAP